MRILLFLVLLMIINNVNGQHADRNIQVGLHTSGRGFSISEIVPPRYQKITYSSVNFYPKIGYSVHGKYNFGIIGNYGFANGTFGNALPVFGGGYYLKYSFMPKQDTTKKYKRFIFFAEWQHVVSNGYHEPNDDLKPIKVDKKLMFLTLQGGVDIRFKKGFVIGLSYGVGSNNFYINYTKPELGDKTTYNHFGRLTLQYDFKL
jgi:hypothetical protein